MKDKKEIILGAFCAILMILIPIAYFGTYPFFYRIESTSMQPTIDPGDWVLIKEKVPEIGDIIIFQNPRSGNMIAHRVIKIFKCNEEICYLTKGDRNGWTDQSLFPEKGGCPRKYIKGVVIYIWSDNE